MTVLATAGGDWALIILAAFWGLLVCFLCIVLFRTFERPGEHEDDDRRAPRRDRAAAAGGQVLRRDA